ncbi:MAG: VWA domain-containing protein [Myxococcales bacterium]|nr:VWA domain-containing protein [Myxococcales bacterium]
MAKDSCLDSTGKALDGNCEGGQICGTDPKITSCDSDAGTAEERCVPFGMCSAGGDCANEFRPERVAPHVMILLDRSGSMGEGISEEGKKWDIAKQAIVALTTAFKGTVRFGLATFSACLDGQGCSAGTIEVPMGDDVDAIHAFLNDADEDFLCNSGFQETSIGASIDSIAKSAAWKETGREHALLLITDGKETCDGNGPNAASAALALSPSVRTFAVGFTQDVHEVDTKLLSAIATSGGTEKHYLATSTTALEEALDSIGGTAALSCTHTLKDNVPDAETEIFVYFDASVDALTQEPVDGWTYDPATTTVTLHGASCDKVKSGEVSEVVVSYDCQRGDF